MRKPEANEFLGDQWSPKKPEAISKPGRSSELQRSEQSSRGRSVFDVSFSRTKHDFCAQSITGARPCFHTAKVFHARLQRAKLQIVHAGFNQRVNSLF